MEKYQRVLRGTGLIQKYWIYRGSDHLLVLEQLLFIQSYYRFFYRDIQGLIMHKTEHFGAGIVLYGLVFFWIGMRVLEHKAGMGTIIIAVLLGLLTLRHLIGGMTCYITIITEVQAKRIGGIQRCRKWRRLKKVLGPIIEEQQRGIFHEETEPSGERGGFSAMPAPVAPEKTADAS